MPMSEDDRLAAHLPLVRRLALQMVARLPANVELDDLIQAGLLGLLDAMRRYESTPDAQFETYATARIRGAMLDELRAQDWLPRTVRSKARSIEQAIALLQQRLMRNPTEGEIAEEMGMSLEGYQRLLEEAQGVQLVHYEDFSADRDGPGHVLDFLLEANASSTGAGSTGRDPFSGVVLQSLRVAVVRAVKELPEREQLVLSLQFEKDLSQKEIAAVLELSEGRISQLRTQAITRIRAYLINEGWPDRPSELQGQDLL